MNLKPVKIILFSLLSLCIIPNGYTQTAGNFTFSVTTTSSGGYSPKHLVAIWIENNSGTFIKTKAKYSSASNLDHLAVWTGKSSSNVTDATTGATLLSHGTLTIVWNGTDVNGALVPDGTYNVWIEMAWASSLTTGKTYTSFSFTKGASTFHSAPASTVNFSGITLDWVPTTSAVQEVKSDIPTIESPNPTNGLVTLKFKTPAKNCRIVISTIDGKVLNKKYYKTTNSAENIDLSKFSKGVYLIAVKYDDKNINYRIVKQ